MQNKNIRHNYFMDSSQGLFILTMLATVERQCSCVPVKAVVADPSNRSNLALDQGKTTYLIRYGHRYMRINEEIHMNLEMYIKYIKDRCRNMEIKQCKNTEIAFFFSSFMYLLIHFGLYLFYLYHTHVILCASK